MVRSALRLNVPLTWNIAETRFILIFFKPQNTMVVVIHFDRYFLPTHNCCNMDQVLLPFLNDQVHIFTMDENNYVKINFPKNSLHKHQFTMHIYLIMTQKNRVMSGVIYFKS